MNHIKLFCQLLFLCLLLSCQNQKTDKPNEIMDPQSTAELITLWQSTTDENRLKGFSFVQETHQIDSTGKADTSTWYEFIQYPNFFRIDFGDKEEQNRVLYRNDSLYSMKGGEIVERRRSIQEFMIMEGSVYTEPVDTVLSMLKEVGTDVTKFRTTQYQGRKTYVIGAEEGDSLSSQVWLDAEMKNTTRRFMKSRRGSIIEARYSDFQMIDGHLIESWLEFYVNDKLVQTERYNDIKVNPDFDPRIFDPKAFGEAYWY